MSLRCNTMCNCALIFLKVMAPNRKICALKRIKLQGRDREAAAGFIDEITLLQKLRGKNNIIQLVDAEASSNLIEDHLHFFCIVISLSSPTLLNK